LALRAILAVAVPVAVGVIWSLFISPKARIPSGRLGRAGLGLIVFLAAAYALYVRGHGALAEPFAVTAAISSVIVYALPQ
jgi:hypothetical protein